MKLDMAEIQQGYSSDRVPYFWRRTGLYFPRLGVMDGLALLIPFTRFLEFHIIGNLYAPDLELLLLFPFLILRDGRLLSRGLPKVLLVLGFLWLLSQMVTDLLRHTSFADYSRGWANITIALIGFCSLYLILRGKPRRIILFAVGMAIGGVISYFVNPDGYAQAYAWKFGYGLPVTWLIVLFAVYIMNRKPGRRFWPAGIMAVAAAVNILMGYRSVAGACFLAAVYLLMQIFWGRAAIARTRLRPRYLVLICVVVIIAGWGTLRLYGYAAGSGLLGPNARNEYERQSGGEYGLLIGGRSEILVSGRAIIHSPIIGYGSWGKNCHYSSLLGTVERRLGYAVNGEGGIERECVIPSHSYLFGQWVDAGLLGAMFWLWVLMLPIRVITGLYLTTERLTPLIAFIAFIFIWDIFFSPFNGEQRYIAMYYIVVMLAYLPGSLGVEKRLYHRILMKG